MQTAKAIKGNVVLSGYILVPAERLAKVRSALVEHISLTRAEAGCIYFDVSPDAEVQGKFNVFEIFTDRVAFDFHQSRTDASLWAKVTAGIDRHYDVKDIV